MKAIQVKYLGPTNYKGARLKAFANGVPAITESLNDALNIDEQAMYLAGKLADRHNWLNGCHLRQGTLPNGDYCHVLIEND